MSHVTLCNAKMTYLLESCIKGNINVRKLSMSPFIIYLFSIKAFCLTDLKVVTLLIFPFLLKQVNVSPYGCIDLSLGLQ